MQSYSADVIKRLCELGARPPIIHSYFRGVAPKEIRAIYKEIQGKSAVRGQLPLVTDLYFTYQRAVRVSLVAKVFVDHRAAGASEAESLISAYEMLLSMFPDRPDLTISQVWHISRCVEIGRFYLRNCEEGHTYVASQDYAVTTHQCPVCKEMIKLDRTLARQEKQIRRNPQAEKKRKCTRQ